MNVSLVLLILLFTVLGLSWWSNQRREPARSETLVYRRGKESPFDPDSDADMQEQYGFRNHKNK